MGSNSSVSFFFNDTATTEIYTLSLHDALPIWQYAVRGNDVVAQHQGVLARGMLEEMADRKSTRLNSSHLVISYAVFCLKKKNTSMCFCLFNIIVGIVDGQLYPDLLSARILLSS